MAYGKDLLDKAAAKAGSRYALAKQTGIAESGLSRAANGERDVPASWVLPLAQIAGVDPIKAMEQWTRERAAKKKARQDVAGRVGNVDEAGGKGPASLTQYASYLLRAVVLSIRTRHPSQYAANGLREWAAAAC